jgi:hypothetical protein
MQRSPLAYPAPIFATSMLFAVVYTAGIISWRLLPDLPPHAVMLSLFPQVSLITPFGFLFGLVCAVIYGAFISALFVFFYNLWPRVAALMAGRKIATP